LDFLVTALKDEFFLFFLRNVTTTQIIIYFLADTTLTGQHPQYRNENFKII